jgi:hypothetical protein
MKMDQEHMGGEAKCKLAEALTAEWEQLRQEANTRFGLIGAILSYCLLVTGAVIAALTIPHGKEGQFLLQTWSTSIEPNKVALTVAIGYVLALELLLAAHIHQAHALVQISVHEADINERFAELWAGVREVGPFRWGTAVSSRYGWATDVLTRVRPSGRGSWRQRLSSAAMFAAPRLHALAIYGLIGLGKDLSVTC